MSDIVDILMTGRDLVIERGHCKRTRSRGDQVCTKEALRLAGYSWAASIAFHRAVRVLYPERMEKPVFIFDAAVSFNDHPDTTPGEVVDVFDYAIACEKEKLALGNEGQR